MTEQSEDLKDSLPTERKHVWRTAEERRMSDLARVLEWLERRQGKKKQALQKNKAKVVTLSAAPVKEEKKAKNVQKQQGGNHQVAFSKQTSGQGSKKDGEASALYRRFYRVEAKGKRLSSMTLGNYPKDEPRKSDLDIKDEITQESTQRSTPYHRQSIIEPMLQDAIFAPRRSTLLRDWVGKTPYTSYERKLKSLMEKGSEPKMETVRLLKPEEVLSCRYLRLSKNNIRTLLKLCKDAGMNVDIHPHVVEEEIDAKKVLNRNISVAL
ncbi:uncharacterized protein C16orf78 homolog [Physeter macrocephalus]|uniref:Uncharacterized protein C16orf78 homolog n=1 Tax=Physeter macrocephalus TaxID=9755 RepID=A0A455ADH5_PHYMC|nr:uncharacterized protein C16orf78 homolog [Physeter catodon]|eukprot:XP_028333329.1 uncharacterized protein C16orf78 homolog [Physeter catodon]